MATDPENFDRLLKLLALMRHEQPPPGYFDKFSREVIVRLKAGEVGRKSWLDDLGQQASWAQKIWTLFEAKPALPGVFGAVVCGFLLAGIIYAQRLDLRPPTLASPPPHEIALVPPNPIAETDASATALLTSSTNPLPTWLFDGTGLKNQAERVLWPAP
jgi:hypothetical protein